jgi:opacity protein-like surface antigen
MSWLLTGVLSVVIVGMARPAAAQDDAPKAEVAGGWNYIAARSQASDTWEHLYKGGFGEVAVNLNDRWGAVGLFAYDQKTLVEVEGDFKLSVVPYLFGARYSYRANAERATPFLHFLAGATRLKISLGSDSESETNFTWQVGGGVNIPINSRVFARAGGDYMHVHGKDNGNLTDGEAIQGLRISAGVGVSF